MLTKLADDNGGADFDATTDSQTEIADSIAGLPTDQDVRDAMMLAPTPGVPAAGSVDQHLDDTLTNICTPIALDGGPADLSGMLTKLADDNGGADFDATTDSQTEIADSIAGLPTDQDVRDAMMLAPTPGVPGADSVDEKLDDIIACCVLGPGAIEFIYTLTDSGTGLPISGADVWVSTDAAGANVIASGNTDLFGNVTFWLDPGTYYFWRQRAGYSFINPDVETVTP
jgi:hypothetical protein